MVVLFARATGGRGGGHSCLVVLFARANGFCKGHRMYGAGKCTKDFPKSCLSETEITSSTYPNYRRRKSNNFAKTDHHGNDVLEMDDSWVVPYNAYLSVRFNAHINLEICNSITSVKYVYKYDYKGLDKASVTLTPVNTP